MKALRSTAPGSEVKLPAPVCPVKYLSNRNVMMPCWARTPATSLRVCGVMLLAGWFPSRSVGPLPASSSAAARCWPLWCAGISSVPYVFVPSTANETSLLAAATSPEPDPDPDPDPPAAPALEQAASPAQSSAAAAAARTTRMELFLPRASGALLSSQPQNG